MIECRAHPWLQDFDGNPMDKRGESKNRVNEAGRKIDKGYKTGLYEKWKVSVGRRQGAQPAVAQ